MEGRAGNGGVARALLGAFLVAVLVVGAAPPAAADPEPTRPEVVVTGSWTVPERLEVARVWSRFTAYFYVQWACLPDLEVRIVDRVEDHYRGRAFGSIAAFYRSGPEPILFVEHGKVTDEYLLHEYVHHLDLSCGVGAGPFAAAFQRAQGIPPEQGWLEGTSWAAVPAEQFAEAVRIAMGYESHKIPIWPQSVALVARLGDPRHALADGGARRAAFPPVAGTIWATTGPIVPH